MKGIITLLGYMGSGKSTYGKLLAKKIGYEFIDLDDYIVEKTGLTISDIFDSKCEIWFREYETKSLQKLIIKNKLLLSLGGGTPIYGSNMKIINSSTESIYLNASVDTLYSYLRLQKANRPIIKDLSDKELKEFIAEHLSKRIPFYSKAKYSIITDDKTILDIVDELDEILK